jgi:antitoxin ParD1/3/4
MNISLTNELEEFVREKVSSGRYLSASEVVREALRLLEQHDELRNVKLDKLKREISNGIAELEQGKGRKLNIDDIKSKGRKKLKERVT